MKYVVPVLLGVVGIIVGAAATFNVFFAIVWGLQLPTRVTIYVQIALALVQVVMLYVALLFGKRMVARAHPLDGLACGLGIGVFGIATQLQMMSFASPMPS